MITIQPAARYRTAAADPTPRVCEVAAMFGLGVDETHELNVVPPTNLTLHHGQLIFITGASGGGKTTLLRLMRDRLADHPAATVIDFDAADTTLPPDVALVDRLGHVGGSLADAVRWLSLAGLNDAAVMLRRPHELSDGQRYRLRLAEAIARAERIDPSREPTAGAGAPLVVILADEFAASLDRLTAKVLARNVRKWSTRAQICFIAATTHDDLLEPLEPDLLIVQQPGDGMRVLTRETDDER